MFKIKRVQTIGIVLNIVCIYYKSLILSYLTCQKLSSKLEPISYDKLRVLHEITHSPVGEE